MNRRQVVTAAIASATPTVLSLTGCDSRSKAASSGPVSVPPFSPQSLHRGMDSLAAAYSAKSPKTVQYLQPGLSVSRVRERTPWFPRPLPPEVISLYQWRNGFAAPKDSAAIPFMFRDCVFLPLEQIQREYESMVSTYGRNPQDAELIASSFPFAALDGGWLVVSASKQTLMPALERPVISVFQGVSVFFYSMEKMAETCVQWLSHPKHNGYSIPPKVEMEVWRTVNPGIFPE